MLFNSYEFIFLFLPVTLFVYFLIGKYGYIEAALSWLVVSSLFFYGWWNPIYLILILVSIFFNFFFGYYISQENNRSVKKLLLAIGVGANLLTLGYFKYANFFIDNVNYLIGSGLTIDKIILPLAISFFTFQQITYLVDASRHETKEYNFLHYCLFVTFFPQLIAGPIVHHKEMLPQFAIKSTFRPSYINFALGTTIFIIGLFKKVVLADNIAIYATPVFNYAESGNPILFVDAWTGALAYTFQLYFDFSGYSDMAIGIARMFGIKLPLNFNSPYKAKNIVDFWRRWHITLSRFLRDYLYIPLGGSKRGSIRRYFNLILTMLLGGLWHGAGWNFVIWGAMHGLYLIINHFWRSVFQFRGRIYSLFCWAVTFLAVIFAWVPFRAITLEGTVNIWLGMLGLNGISLPARLENLLNQVVPSIHSNYLIFEGVFQVDRLSDIVFLWLISLLAIATLFPNTQQIMRRYRPAFETYKNEIKRTRFKFLEWRPSVLTALFSLCALFYALYSMSNISEFLYFNF